MQLVHPCYQHFHIFLVSCGDSKIAEIPDKAYYAICGSFGADFYAEGIWLIEAFERFWQWAQHIRALPSAPRTALHWDSKGHAESPGARIIVHPCAGLSVDLLGAIIEGLGMFIRSGGAYFEVAFVVMDMLVRVLMSGAWKQVRGEGVRVMVDELGLDGLAWVRLWLYMAAAGGWSFFGNLIGEEYVQSASESVSDE
ncbi:hypothetical protein G7Y79_00080g100680 [Physcia stellaris]|nr:hypothetical protein G7Y79_00080g100680 [Physcia stellaris]